MKIDFQHMRIWVSPENTLTQSLSSFLDKTIPCAMLLLFVFQKHIGHVIVAFNGNLSFRMFYNARFRLDGINYFIYTSLQSTNPHNTTVHRRGAFH